MSYPQQQSDQECASGIPLVDLGDFNVSPDAKRALAHRISHICHHTGFFIVTRHGVDPTLIDEVFDTSRRLFDLPPEHKHLIDKRHSPHFRGWEGEGAEYTNNLPDIREQVDLWSEHPARDPAVTPGYLRLLGPNQWLPESILPGYRELMARWFRDVGQLADRLMGLLALGLDLEEHHFADLFGSEQMSLTKLIRYPATPVSGFGVNAHHDTGFLTVLAPGTVPGLEVEDANGDWMPVPIVPGSFVINLGEMLQAMTGNYYVATPHRVFTNEPRYSVGYFHGPSLETMLNPVPLSPRHVEAVSNSPRHANAGFMARPEETVSGVKAMQSRLHASTYGEQVWNYFCRSYPDNVRRHYPESAD